MEFAARIVHWYDQNKRELPWRSTRDPYRIWLSEILMQQTRIEQGTPYYLRFVEAFPNVHALAGAEEEAVMKLWQGLGYYNRARNLHATARFVSEELKGVFPNQYTDLLKLKGVGTYTASAIASICFEEARAVVDGNVYRVLSRHFGIETPIDRPEGQRQFHELAQKLLPAERLGDYNQGLMEFGAVQCKPRNPDCLRCPVQNSCVAWREERVGLLPVKVGKTKVKKEVLHYALKLDDKGEFEVRRRPSKGYWPGLYEFPGIVRESLSNQTRAELSKEIALEDSDELQLWDEKPMKHQLSHRALELYFWITPSVSKMDDQQRREVIQKAEKRAWPVPLADLLRRIKF